VSRIYDVTLGAAIGASANIPAMGDKVKVYSAPQGAVTIRTDTGESYTLLEGQGFTLPPGKTFRDLIVSNGVAIGQTCQIFAGDARIEDSRVTGTVRIIDSSKDRSLAGRLFFGSDSVAANATQFGIVTCGANGANVAVRGLHVSSDVAGSILLGTITSAGTATPYTNPVPNRYIGQAASTARTFGSLTAAITPSGAEAPGFAGVARVFVPANTDLYVPLADPLILTGTRGLVATGQLVNRQLNVAFELEEF
jgi:hypothetical protein